MITGKIKWFDPARGYGFITFTADGDEGDVFVHALALTRSGIAADTIGAGDVLEFEIEPQPDGRTRAVKLRLVERAARAPRERVTRTGGW